MSFLMPELITSVVIEDRLQFLSEHPDHINWMLSPFVNNSRLARMVDPKYVEKCIEYITHNRPMVRPVYELDINKMPSIVVASYQGESQQFLGDYGGDSLVAEYEAQTLLSFNATLIESNTIKLPPNQGVYEKVWSGLFFRSGGVSSKITALSEDPDTKEVTIFVEDELPVGTALRGCKIMSSIDQKWYKINSSIDAVKVSITLTTNGDHAIHRLMGTLLRYCLKSGRVDFDSYGMQVATFSQQPVQLVDDTQLIWQTQFVLDCKIADHWIVDEGGLVTAPAIVNIKAENEEGSVVEVDDWV